jgi:hypothetical protein
VRPRSRDARALAGHEHVGTSMEATGVTVTAAALAGHASQRCASRSTCARPVGRRSSPGRTCARDRLDARVLRDPGWYARLGAPASRAGRCAMAGIAPWRPSGARFHGGGCPRGVRVGSRRRAVGEARCARCSAGGRKTSPAATRDASG